MKINKITYQHRRDFQAVYECEGCGHTCEDIGTEIGIVDEGDRRWGHEGMTTDLLHEADDVVDLVAHPRGLRALARRVRDLDQLFAVDELDALQLRVAPELCERGRRRDGPETGHGAEELLLEEQEEKAEDAPGHMAVEKLMQNNTDLQGD